MGCTVSNGYREFKVSDGYREDVLALIFNSLGAVRDQSGSGRRDLLALQPDATDLGAQEFATFVIAGSLFAVPAEHVREALFASHMSRVLRTENKACIRLLALQGEGDSNASVWVFDLAYVLRGVPLEIEKTSQVVIVRQARQTIGLLVDALHGVPKFNAAQITPSSFANHADGALVKYFIKANRGDLLIQAIDVACLFVVVMQREPTIPNVELCW
jgi:chemotaxis signal transduction protein